MDRSEWCQMDWTPKGMHKKKWTCRQCGESTVRDGSIGHPHVRCAAPPPPAEQASGEHVEALVKLRQRERETADAHGRTSAEWFKRQDAALNAAIAALSQRPVVDEAMKARTRDWLATHGGYWDNDYVTRLLTAALAPQQPEKGEG